MRVPSTLLVVGIAALAIALLPLPYGYYTLLKVVMCGLFSYLAYLSWQSGGQELTWVCGVIVAIYNPFVPIHLGREVWVLVNIATMGVLATFGVDSHRSSSKYGYSRLSADYYIRITFVTYLSLGQLYVEVLNYNL